MANEPLQLDLGSLRSAMSLTLHTYHVQAIGPVLHHHPAALLYVFGMVVGGADAVGVGVRELGVPHTFG
jgi:hypothetical protein